MNNTEKYEQALYYEIFIKEEYGFANKIIKKSNCIFDIGGHIGYFSKWCRGLNDLTYIHYFEPVKNSFNKAKLELGKDKNIFLNNYGIGDQNSKGFVLINETKTMQSSKFISFLNPYGKSAPAQFITLGEYLNKNSILKIDLLKMDIEGMEFEVLNSRNDYERGIIQNLIAEIHLLNNDMKKEWDLTLQIIKKNFNYIKIIPSKYREEIFLIWCNKKH